jgi:hypothetical protein
MTELSLIEVLNATANKYADCSALISNDQSHTFLELKKHPINVLLGY